MYSIFLLSFIYSHIFKLLFKLTLSLLNDNVSETLLERTAYSLLYLLCLLCLSHWNQKYLVLWSLGKASLIKVILWQGSMKINVW